MPGVTGDRVLPGTGGKNGLARLVQSRQRRLLVGLVVLEVDVRLDVLFLVHMPAK